MRFAVLAQALERAEATASRLETAATLAEALKPLDGQDIAFAVNFLLGQLGPAFEAPPVGIGDKTAIKALAAVAGEDEALVAARMREVGDLGEVAAQAVAKSKQRPLFAEPLDLGHVRAQLVAIATANGKGSGERKLKMLQELLLSATPPEAKYIVRFLVGRMRVGIGEGAIMEALAAAKGDRKRKPEVEAAYNRHPDLASIARRLQEGGFEALQEVKVTPLVPVRPMLAERLKTLEEILEKLGGRAAFDYKYDGLRMQIHYKAGEVRLQRDHDARVRHVAGDVLLAAVRTRPERRGRVHLPERSRGAGRASDRSQKAGGQPGIGRASMLEKSA